jgi:hypothetical protein
MLEGWRAGGAEILPFSPLADEAPDASADLVWLGSPPPHRSAPRPAPYSHRTRHGSAWSRHERRAPMLEGWRAGGAEILPFSPLADEAPDASADLVWLPGRHIATALAMDRLGRGMSGEPRAECLRRRQSPGVASSPAMPSARCISAIAARPCWARWPGCPRGRCWAPARSRGDSRDASCAWHSW